MESNQQGPTYVAFMADVIGSREVPDPVDFQRRFVAAVDAAARATATDSPLTTPVEVTGGDEAKGLYANLNAAWSAFLAIQAEIHPQRLRVGFGIGPVLSGHPDAEARIGALNGPCLVDARHAIDTTERHGPVRIHAPHLPAASAVMHTLSLALLVRHDWKPKQARYAYALDRGLGVGAIAETYGVSDATVSGSLASSQAHAVHNAEVAACALLDAALPAEATP